MYNSALEQGTGSDVLEEALNKIYNDKVGRRCTATLKELLQKDYKIVDDPPPVGKDFNDFLLSYLGIARPKPARERSDVR